MWYTARLRVPGTAAIRPRSHLISVSLTTDSGEIMQAIRITTFKLTQAMLITLLTCTVVHAGGGKIHKWVDEKGVTHYGDKMPAKDVHRDNAILNNQGVVIRRNQLNHQQEVDEALLEQQRRDRALRASYTTEDEIDLARDRHLQMDHVAIQALEQRKAGALKRLGNSQKSAESFHNRQKPVPDDLSAEIAEIKSEISRIDQQIDARKNNMELTRTRFNEDKQRFIEIKAQN